MRQDWKKAGVTIEESVVKARLMGKPEKTDRLILARFSISVSYVMNCFRFVFNNGCNLCSMAKAYTRHLAALSIL